MNSCAFPEGTSISSLEAKHSFRVSRQKGNWNFRWNHEEYGKGEQKPVHNILEYEKYREVSQSMKTMKLRQIKRHLIIA